MRINPSISISAVVTGIILALCCLAAILIILQNVLEHLLFKGSTMSLLLDFLCFIVVLNIPGLSAPIYLKLLIIVAIIFLLKFWPKIVDLFNVHEVVTYNHKLIDGYRSVIESDPANIAARVSLVDALRSEGRLDEAIKEQQELLQLVPNDAVQRNKLGRLVEDREESIRGVIICPSCGFRNYADLTECRNCFEKLRIKDYIKSKIVRGGTKRLIASLGILCAIILLMAILTADLGFYSALAIELFIIPMSIFALFVFLYRNA